MNNGEYFLIETEDELRQAYEMFGSQFYYTLEEEIKDFLKYRTYRVIYKSTLDEVILTSLFSIEGTGEIEIPSPLKKNTITNPIKDNRIVSDKTFALRLCGFLDDIYVSDACSDDEASYLKSVARELLTYQYQTATDKYEVGYIERLEDRFKQYLEEGFTTEDGYTFYRGDNVRLFSCMRQPNRSDDNSMVFRVSSILEGGVNPNRVFFKEEANRDKYIEDNLIQYSKKDLEELVKNK